MPEPASPPDLSSQIGRYGPSAQLVTVTGDGRPHVTAVDVTAIEGGLSVPAGGHSRANAAVHPAVTLLWPAPVGSDHSLVVDGTASVAGERLVIRPSSALLHRVAHAPVEVPRCFGVDVSGVAGSVTLGD
jgi:hypothetical protein